MPNTNKQDKKSKARANKAKRTIRKITTFIVGVAIVIGVVVALTVIIPARPGYPVTTKGAGHMPSCTPEYNSSPATSGCHSTSPAPYEIYTDSVDERRMVHSLEHGGVAIQYRTSGILGEDDQLIDDLTSLINRLKNADSKYCRLILAPYDRAFQTPTVNDLKDTARDNKIALTAWTHIDLLDAYDEERIIAFADAFLNRGPESLNDC
jgi:hypothetical protein